MPWYTVVHRCTYIPHIIVVVVVGRIVSFCYSELGNTVAYKAPASDDGDNKIEEKKIHPFIISRFTLGRPAAAPFFTSTHTQFTIILSTRSAGCSCIIYSVLYLYMYMHIRIYV